MVGSSSATIKRGALIVLEGCDRSGKSTQSRLLFEALQAFGHDVKHMGFPNRSSSIGKVINGYLTNQQELTDECIHLLFCANRWEFKQEMNKLLQAGTTLIVDRYSYSGVAYTAAKGLNFDWCMAPERGLIRPDAVFYLKTDIDKLLQRGNFGAERYEKEDFQKKVASIYERMLNTEKSYWHEFDANQTREQILSELISKALEVMRESAANPLKTL